MNKTFYLAALSGITLLSSTASAQDSIVKTRHPYHHWTVGLEVGASRRFSTPNEPLYEGGMTHSGIGIASRYYFNEHLALKAAVSFGGSETINSSTAEYNPSTLATTYYDGQRKLTRIDIPIQAEYHFGKAHSAIRPYFGIGVITNILKSEGVNTTRSIGYADSHAFNFTEVKPHLMITQGLTWQISRHWQLDESIQYHFYNTAPKIGVNLGLQYRIR